MEPRKKIDASKLKLAAMALMAALLALAAASCGGGKTSSQTASGSTKLPPGAGSTTLADDADSETVTRAQATDEDDGGEDADDDGTASSTTASADPTKTAYLSGADFSVVSVSRSDSNDVVAGSSVRELSGDFLEIELVIKNVGGELVDLSDFSFRLWNPAIDADLYEDFYGSGSPYGSYVSENMISGALLDYETLQTVSVKLRVGESLGDVFLFLDLNPQSTARNEGVTLEGTNLVIYDTDSGEKAEINLSGFTG